MPHLDQERSTVPSRGDSDSLPGDVNQQIAQNTVVSCNSEAVNQTRLTSCFHPNTSQGAQGSTKTPSLASPVPDSVQFGQPKNWTRQSLDKQLTEFHELPQAAQDYIRARCPFFTRYAHIESSAARRRARSADQRQVDNGAGCLGPNDHLRASIRSWLADHPPADQPSLDFASVTNLPIPPQKIPSVLRGISASPAVRIAQHHLREWVEKSGIDEELTRCCIQSISGEAVLQLLRPTVPAEKLGQERKRLGDVLNGGWQCLTLKVARGAEGFEAWGCYKPDHPRAGWKKDRATGNWHQKLDEGGRPVPMKYEHPAGVGVEPFFLPFPRHIGERIARSNRCLAAYRAWEDGQERTFSQRWRWFLQRGCTVWITEGAKKTAALLTAGQLAIGLSGIWNGCPKDGSGKACLNARLRRALQLGTKRVIVAFDWSEPDSKAEAAVLGATDRLCRVIQYELNRSTAKKVECHVIDLPGPEKGVDDILVASGIEGIEALQEFCLPFRRWQAKNNQKVIRRRIDVPIALDSGRQVQRINQRYLTAKDIPQDARLLAAVSAMESGKTEAIVNYASLTGLPTFIPLHRRSLAANVAERFRLPYQSEGKLIRPWLTGASREVSLPPPNADNRHFGTELEAQREAEEHGKVVVLDSSHAAGSSHLDPESCRGALLVLDEWDASAMHLLTGATEIQSHRTEILDNFVRCLQAAKQVIIASAHLHEQVVRYLEKLLDTRAHVLINEYRPADGRQCFVYEKDSDWLEALSTHIGRGENVYISATAQKSASVYGASNLASYISDRLKVPAAQILVVDSETTRTVGHPARGILSDPSQLLQFRVVIATPVIETGVSIKDPLKHFAACFGINWGNTSPQACVQALGRVRSDVPRYLFVARNGRTLFGGGTTADDIIRLSTAVAVRQRDSLFRAGIAEAELPIVTQHVTAWAALTADHNLLAKEQAFSTRALLQAEGYRVLDGCAADEELAKTYKDQLKEAGEQNTRDQCQEVSQSTPVEQDEIEELERRSELTVQQQRSLEHGKINRDFGVESATPAQVDAYRRRAFTAYRTEMLLTEMQRNGESDTLKQLDGLTAMKRKNITRDSFLGDFIKAFQQPTIALLHRIEALRLIQRRDEFTMSDPALLAIYDRAKAARSECRAHLGIDPATVRPSTFFRHLAERLGYELRRQQQRRNVNGKAEWTFVIDDAFRGVDRHQVQAHIRSNIGHRYDQALDDAIGPDADPYATPQAVEAATFQSRHDQFLDSLDDDLDL